MLAHKLSRHGCVCLDDAITGANMERPGLVELIDESLSNKNISHIFVYMRDRLARPENPLEMMVIEVQLLQAGLTLVFSDAVATPCTASPAVNDGSTNADAIKALRGPSATTIWWTPRRCCDAHCAR